MRSVYVSLVLFFAVAIIGNVVWYRIQNAPSEEFKSIEGHADVEVDADQATLTFERREPLKASLREANELVAASLANFRLDPAAQVFPVETVLDFQNNGRFLARSSQVSGTVLVSVTDVTLVPAQMERALAFGMNVIGATKWRVSPAKLLEAVEKGRSAATADAQAEAEDFSRVSGRKLVRCEPGPGDPLVGGGGAGLSSGGLGAMEDHPEVVPIADLIRPIGSMTIPEPVYQGEVHLAPTVTPRRFKVQVSRFLSCVFG